MSTNSSTVLQDPSSPPVEFPLTFTAFNCLSEDHLLTADILVEGGATSPVAMWQNAQGQSEALVIGSDGQLSHLHRDPNSDSGRDLQPVAQDLKVSEVVAAKDTDGAVNAFLVDSTDQLRQLRQNADGTWPAPTDLGCKATNITVTNNADADSPLAVCGVTPAGHLLAVAKNPTTGRWEPNDFPDNLAGIQLQVQTISYDADQITLMVYAIIDGQVCAKGLQGYPLQPASGQWIPLKVSPGQTAPPKNVVQLAVAPLGNLQLAVGSDNSLWAIAIVPMGGLAVFSQITGVKAQHVSVTQQAQDDRWVQAYVTDTDGCLWVLRQSGVDQMHNYVPTWYPPVPLGDHLLRTFTPAGGNDQAETLAIDTGSTMRSLSQDPTTKEWTSLAVQQSAPPDEPAHVSSYLTTASLEDANGVPVAGAQVAINSKPPATIWVDGVAYDVGPNQAATCQTDLTGKLNIMSLAMGLDTPSLTLSTNGLDQSESVVPYQEVHDYLAGDATTLNDIQQPFDGSVLKNAQGADNQPLAPDLTDEGAQAVAEGIKQTMTLRPSSSLAASGASPASRLRQPLLTAGGDPATGWTMDFSDPNTPTFTPMSAQEITDHRTQLQGQLLGSIWDDLKKFAGDVWHAIKNAAMKVKTLVVDAVKKTVSLTLSIADQVGHLLDVAINGIEDVVHVIHTVFAAIGAEIERVVEWLRALFNWHDILNTHKVLEYYLSNLTTPLKDLIDNHAKPGVDEFFTGLEQKITDNFDDLKCRLEGKNLTHLASGNSSTPDGGVPTDNQGVLDPNTVHNHPRHHWVFAKAQANAAGTTGLGVDADDSLQKPLTDFVHSVDSAMPDIKDGLKKLGEFIRGVVEHPADLKQLVINDLIDVIKDIILALIEVAHGVVLALLDLADLALDGLKSFFTKQAKIPLLSALFKTITQGEDLTVAGLLALIVAVPATLSYKLVHGVDKQLFTDAMVAQLTSPAPADTLRATREAVVGDASDNNEASKALAWTSGAVQMVWAACDTALDLKPDIKTPVFKGLFTTAGVGLPALAQFTWWPNDDGVPFYTPRDTEYHKANLAMWVSYWFPPVIDLVFLGAPGLEKLLPIKGGQLARYEDPWGNYLLCFLGIEILVASCVASALGDKDGLLEGVDVASNVLGPLSYIGQPLRIESIQDAYEKLPLALQLLNDFFTGIGCGACMLISAGTEY